MTTRFNELFSDTLEAISLSAPDRSYDERFSAAWEATKSAARAVRLSDPSVSPTPVSPAQQAEYDALDANLLESSVDRALQNAADSRPKTPVPELGNNLNDALAKIASTQPPMSKTDAIALATAAQKKDRELWIARQSALANPPAPGNVGQVRA